MPDDWDDKTPSEPKVEPVKTKKSEIVTPKLAFDDFEPAVDIPGVRSFKICVYGLDKVGKSWFAAHAPKPIYAFDTENKFNIAVQQMSKDERKDIFIMNMMDKVKDDDGNFDKVRAIDYIHEKLMEVKNLDHGTLVFDSFSSISSWIAFWFENSPDVQKTDSGKPYRFEYGKAKNKFIQIGELLQQTKMNIVCTAWAKPKVLETGANAGYNIMDSRSGSGYFFEFYGELTKIGNDRVFVVRGSNYGQMEGFEVVDPSFMTVKKAISEHTGVEFFV